MGTPLPIRPAAWPLAMPGQPRVAGYPESRRGACQERGWSVLPLFFAVVHGIPGHLVPQPDLIGVRLAFTCWNGSTASVSPPAWAWSSHT